MGRRSGQRRSRAVRVGRLGSEEGSRGCGVGEGRGGGWVGIRMFAGVNVEG